MNMFTKIIIAIFVIGLILLYPLVISRFIDSLYFIGYILNLSPNTMYSANDLLQFWGAYLTFLGTVVLGTVSLLQNQRLHNKNNELETIKYIVENEPHLIQTNSSYTVKWKAYQTCHIEKSAVNDVVLVDENFNHSSSRFCLISGEVIILTINNYELEYKIKNLSLSISDNKLHKTNFKYKTNDDFKIAIPVPHKTNEFKLFFSMYCLKTALLANSVNPDNQQKIAFDKFLSGDFDLTITMSIDIKCNKVIAPYFLYFNISPNNRKKTKNNFNPRHKLIINNVIKEGSSRLSDNDAKSCHKSKNY